MPLHDPEPESAPLSALQREAEWVQGLAHRLVADPHRADDLAQDAWVALLEGGSAAGRIRSPRAWMVGTLRKLAARRTRSDMRREARELAAARPERTPATADVVAEVALQREVSGAVLELDEPYRTALLLRFHRALTLEELARVQGVSIATAHNRVRRGIELLREQLDRGRGGDRNSWVLALLPLAERALDTAAPLVPLTAPALVGTLGLGALAMGTATKLAAALLVTVGGAVGFWQLQRAPVETRGAEPAARVPLSGVVLEPAPGAASQAGPNHVLASQPSSSSPAQRTEAPTHVAPAEEPVAAALVTREGRVVDLSGEPVGGVAVHLTSMPAREPEPGEDLQAVHAGVVSEGYQFSSSAKIEPVRSGPDGSFEITLPERSLGRLEVRDEDWVTVSPSFEAVLAKDAVRAIVVARRGLIAGFVHDSEGLAVANARCSVLVLDRVYAQAGVQPGWTAQEGSVGGSVGGTETGEDGRFAIEGGPTGDGLLLLFEKDGYESERVALGEVAADSLDVELGRLAGADVFWGMVVDAGGQPVEGATVSGGGVLVKTDAAGEFRLERGSAEMFPGMDDGRIGRVLCAVLEGYLPGELWITPEVVSPVVLRLGPAALTQRGRVVDGEGQPVAGAAVWSPDQTLLGMRMKEGASSSFGQLLSVESALSGGKNHVATTAADGTFELTGLLDRSYTFRAYDPRRFAVGEAAEAHPGGPAIELLLETDQLPRVAGHLLSTAGEPLVGVRVMPMRFPFGVGEPWTWPQISPSHEMVLTDAEGAFAFARISTDSTSLSFHGAHVKAYHAVQLAEEVDLEDIEVRLGLQVSFTLDLSRDPAMANQFELLDTAGQQLEILKRSGNSEFSNPRMYLGRGTAEDGQSAVYSTSDAARTLVLYRGDEEVVRLPVEFVPGEVNRIAP